MENTILVLIVIFQCLACAFVLLKCFILGNFYSKGSSAYMTSDRISIRDSNNGLMTEVLASLNEYLGHNKGNAADFHLLKNIVDRHTDTLDEEVGHLLPVPLYLGLAGTMVGIICGLWGINGQIDANSFFEVITLVIGDIKKALGCSLLGLIITTILSALVYRVAKARMEQQKNRFLDEMQSKLLPHLNEDASATLLNMQSNLKNFNDSFSENNERFETILSGIGNIFQTQTDLIKRLEQMDLVQMSRLNITTLEKLHTTTQEFERFTQYLSQMNTFVHDVTSLTASINQQLERTQAVEEVSNGMRDNITRNQEVMNALRAFLQKVDANKALLQASENVEVAMHERIGAMRAYIEQEVGSLQTYTNSAAQDLEQLMQRERGHLTKLDRLADLSKLEDLDRTMRQMSDSVHNVNTALAKRVAELAKAVEKGPSTSNGGSRSILPKWMAWILAIVILVTCGFVMWGVVKTTATADEGETVNSAIAIRDSLQYKVVPQDQPMQSPSEAVDSLKPSMHSATHPTPNAKKSKAQQDL